DALVIKLPDKQSSLWLASATLPGFSNLQNDLEVDTVIVGGGIAGLTTAYLLKKSGHKVAVIEKNTIASGTTSKTTGKLTSQHGITYFDLKERHGAKIAKLYGRANQA